MALDPRLLEILACPKDKGPLLWFSEEQHLYNPRLRLKYLVSDSVPNMLESDAEHVDDAEHDRLLDLAEARGIQPNFDDQGS
jgi:uncharacterized protein